MIPATDIYLASASEQLLVVEHYAAKLKSDGFTITHEWTADIREAGFKPDVELSDTVRRYAAAMDAHGVKIADLVWVLTPSYKHEGCGMWIEMGMALALKKRVVVSGQFYRRSVFSDLAEASFPTHDEALEYIRTHRIRP